MDDLKLQKQVDKLMIEAGAPGRVFNLRLPKKVVQDFCFAPSGTFTMGSLEGEFPGYTIPDTQIEVTITKPFWIAKTQVTQAQWQVVMGDNPSHFKGEDRPVENVSWDDVQSYIDNLNQSDAIPEGWKLMLPTEAQWEYACRAGGRGLYFGGSLDEVGWHIGNCSGKTNDVGLKKPNAWGLYDMHGNVYEWCGDWYGDKLMGGNDPAGPSLGHFRVMRGGCWRCEAFLCRAAFRFWYRPENRICDLGFRPVLVPSS